MLCPTASVRTAIRKHFRFWKFLLQFLSSGAETWWIVSLRGLGWGSAIRFGFTVSRLILLKLLPFEDYGLGFWKTLSTKFIQLSCKLEERKPVMSHSTYCFRIMIDKK